MKILMVNKFLYPNGGSETYIFKLGEQLQKMGQNDVFLVFVFKQMKKKDS